MGSSNEGSSIKQVMPAANDSVEKDKTPSLLSRIFAPFLKKKAQQSADTRTQAGLGALRRLRVHDVAIPAAEVVAVPLDISREALVEVYRAQGFSRLPVYKKTLDHPQGLILLKDFALKYGFGSDKAFDLSAMIRPLLYAPPSMPLAVLLQKMQRERVHMALVIDEYGGVDGLVTIEDLIETVIGEIEDEHDENAGPLWSEEKPGVFFAQSTVPLDAFEKAIGLRLSTDYDDADTLGGLISLRIGRVPARGEVVRDESGVDFEIVDADPRRIKSLRVRLGAAKDKLSRRA